MKLIIIIGALIGHTCILLAQNLVPNGGFENYSKCPGTYSQHEKDFKAIAWSSANAGTPDLFNACSRGEGGVPHNWAGTAPAFEGNGYAGIYVWMATDNEYREYLQCKLLERLVTDSVYQVSFRYRLSSYALYCVDRIGLLLSDTSLHAPHDKVLAIQPTMEFVADSALTLETGSWESASFLFKARGGEHYLTIGNFSKNDSTRVYKIHHRDAQQPMLARSSYYYIDDVKVTPLNARQPVLASDNTPEFLKEEVELNKNYILSNINFEFDSYRLTTTSFEVLDHLVLWLKDHNRIKILLEGHTDDQGGDRYNLLLSRNRAKSVASYLSSQGIEESRLESIGYGKKKPLTSTKDEKARAQNRRVEITFRE